ncbi:hypothetical protein DFQ01_12339 [Paenibacillus cellulosilyticus]|uniref:Uncharacterized protein n=1 Tax=Paenibacillus cellulosilyticus TaxID=375489 RepID=A0A2V2YNF9_9BACL|nr:hypothetical protein [Paenibacillus cellulosilyticus]PWV95962.1 hypothetical protein DFQ01_12339 [Paenibacillus cellulosilyticus]QKS48430.1 hypothetical protein HUB94_29740 [Paenibacillus cellulosilyticus]
MVVVLILSIGFGLLLYIISFRKAKFQIKQYYLLSDKEVVIQELRNSFTGYALCLDFVRYETSTRMIQEIGEIMEQASIPLLVFDAAGIVLKIPEVRERLKIEYLPILVKVQEGEAVTKGIFLPPLSRSWSHLVPVIK